MDRQTLRARFNEIDAHRFFHQQRRMLKAVLKEIYAEEGGRDRIRDNFRILLALRKSTCTDLSREIGCTASALYRILDAEVIPSSEMIKTLAEVLGIQLEVLLIGNIPEEVRNLLQQLNVEAIAR